MTEFTVRPRIFGKGVAPEPPNRAGLKLEVIAGAHRGAVLLLDGSAYRIGSSPVADIVLSDPGVAAEHAALHIERGSVRIEAVGADMTVGQEPLPLSRGCHVRLPVGFSVGAAQIHLSDPGRVDPGRGVVLPGISLPLAVAGALACASLTAALASREFPRIAGIVSRAVASASHYGVAYGDSVSLPPEKSLPAEGGSPSRVSARDAIDALKTRIDAAHIQTLQVSIEDDRVVATGTLSGSDVAEWAGIQQWFDKAYGGDIVLTSRIAPPSGPRAMPYLQLQAVWYGENPYIVMADGGHYFKGAVLDNGWVIRDIGEDRVLLVKDQETVALTYR